MKRRKRRQRHKTFPTLEQIRRAWALARRADPMLVALMEATVEESK